MTKRPLTPAEVNHLRRLLGWVACEVGQPPEEMVPMVQSIVRQLGSVSDEGKARLVAGYVNASNVPKYVRAAVKALRQTVREADARPVPDMPVADVPDAVRLPTAVRLLTNQGST